MTVLPAGLVLLGGFTAWRVADDLADRRRWRSLLHNHQPREGKFDPSMVAALPAAAQRYFLFSILPDAQLRTITLIDMEGEIGLGTKSKPGYLPMRARQVLAPPAGFVWSVQAGRGLMHVSGSDGMVGNHSWTRFSLLFMVPVVRAGRNSDHLRSSYGRMIAEAALWSPAALLPGPGVKWQEVDEHTAQVTVTHGQLSQTVTIAVGEDGRPTKVAIRRWSNVNPERRFQVQPFGGYLSEFSIFDGYRLATHVDGGNFIDTPDFFPFYRARVKGIRFCDIGSA